MKKLQKLWYKKENEALYSRKCIICTFVKNVAHSYLKLRSPVQPKKYNLNFRFMMKMGFFAVYTQKVHSSDLRSFTHCFRYKPHLIS